MMTPSPQQLESYLQKMADGSQEILELDFENEGNVERLVVLQEQQDHLRAILDGPLSQGEVRTLPTIKGMIKSCLELERDVNRKLTIYRNFISEQMNKLQDANKSKSAYGQGYSQAEGYFIDFKK